MRESRTYGSVRAKAEWLSYSTSGMSQEDIAQATGHSLSLIREYLDLMDDFKLPPLPNPSGKDGATN